MTNSGPQLWVNGALEMSPNISYQPLSTARFASLTLPLYMNGNSFKLVNSSPFESGDGQNAVIFIGTNDVQKIGFQATYSGQFIKIRLYWVGSWGKWQTFSLT